MRIVFDNIIYSLQERGGISRFWSKITEPHLGESLFIEREDAQKNIYRLKQEPLYRYRSRDHSIPLKISRYLNFKLGFSIKPYIFHSSYYRISKDPCAINVTTIHDVIYEKFGKGLGAALHLIQKTKSLSRASCIVCVSENTKRDLLMHYPTLKNKLIEVIPNGVEPISPILDTNLISFSIQNTASITPFFLYVGHRGSCKGFDRVYQAIQVCPSDWRCIVVGSSLTRSEQAFIERKNLNDRIVVLSGISDTTLWSLYQKAAFFFFPSLYEGFGIPPLEAMELGCPVVASNRSSIPEVVGDAGLLFDPDIPETLHKAISQIIQPAIREKLRSAGYRRASMFRWSVATQAYADLYLYLLNHSGT